MPYLFEWFKGSMLSSKIDESFADYFLKTKANNKCFIVLKCTRKAKVSKSGKV